MNGSLTPDLRNDLIAELVCIRDKITEQHQLEAAALTLLGFDPADDAPAATFTADDARQHEARKPVEKAAKKGKRGGAHPRANLSATDLAAIRARGELGEYHSRIALDYPCSRSTIANVIDRKGVYANV